MINDEELRVQMENDLRKLKEKLRTVDLVIEVLDARAPESSLNPDFDDLFSQKTRFYILNKADLADENITRSWLRYFGEKDIRAVSFSAAHGNVERLKKQIVECAAHLLQRYRERGMNKTLRCAIVGIPNVGKSAILNRLSGEKKLREGNRPGVTKALQWAKIDDHLEIMDTPGLLWPKFQDEISQMWNQFITMTKRLKESREASEKALIQNQQLTRFQLDPVPVDGVHGASLAHVDHLDIIVAVRRKTNKPRVRPDINQFPPLQQLSRIHHKLLPARIPLLFHFRLAVQNRLFLLRNPGQVCYNFLFHDYSSHFSRFFCFLLYSILLQISNVLFIPHYAKRLRRFSLRQSPIFLFILLQPPA